MKTTLSSLTGSLPVSYSKSISNIGLTLFLGIALLGISASVTSAQTTNALNAPLSFSVLNGSPVSVLSLERRAFGLVNREREANGLKPLAWIEKAADVARYHSNSMARSEFLGHRDMAGKKVAYRADKLGFSNWSQLGENVVWISGYDDPAARAVFCWMRSPGHRRNIMDRTYSETGLGISIGSDGKYYFTQVFVSPR